jgi:hypothetical protein
LKAKTNGKQEFNRKQSVPIFTLSWPYIFVLNCFMEPEKEHLYHKWVSIKTVNKLWAEYFNGPLESVKKRQNTENVATQ